MNIRPLQGTLGLTNKGGCSLFFLGVGSAFTRRRNQTNLLIIKGRDHLLVDCGSKGPQALHSYGVAMSQIQHIIITHSHSDHIGGLEELALTSRYMTKKKPHMYITEAYQHILWDMSMRGGSGFNEDNAGDTLSFSDFFIPVRPGHLAGYPRDTCETDVGGINIKLMRTKHIPDNSRTWESSFWSCGVLIDDRILFTSDTRFDRELVMDFESRFRLDAIFHDCQFFKGGVHASLEELTAFPPEIRKKMYLTHYGDNWEAFEEKVRKAGFAGLAQEGVFYE